jgi:folate-binding protein YgfZ
MEPLALHSAHLNRGARFTTLGGKELVQGYGDAAAEYRAAREGTALFDLSARELTRLTGEDRASFLHGMVTNEINALPEGGVTYAAMLTPKGAMVADARIWNRGTDLLLETEPGHGASLRAFLEKYLISEDAELHEADSAHAVLSLLGPKSHAAASSALGTEVAPAAGKFQLISDLAVTGSHLGRPGLDLLVPRARLGELFEKLAGAGAVPVGLETWEVLRVEAGIPRFGQDMEETTIPLEANLERAINYQKGCYIGQEVIARATFRGQMSRKLVGLLLGDQQPEPKTELRRGEKKIGWLTSVVRSPARGQVVALGYVHRDSLEPGTQVQIAGAGEATVQALPLVPG